MNESTPGGLGPSPLPQREGGLDVQNTSGAERLKAKHDEIKRRGTPPGTKRGPYKRGTESASNPGMAGSAPSPTLPPWNFENTRSVCEIPFEFAALARDKAGWRLSEEDARAVIPLTVPVFNQFVPLQGKWTALSLCALVWLKVVGAKVFQDIAHEKALALERESVASAQKDSPSQVKPISEVSAASGVGPLSPTKAAVIH